MKEKEEQKKSKPKQSEEQQSKKEQNAAEDKIAELTNILQRLQADFENYKRRTEEEKIQQISYANFGLIKKFLPLLDNFELALKNKDNKEDFVKGMELIYSQFIDTLKNENIKKIDAIGKEFNPNLHEAMMAEESDKKQNTILEEFQAGYMMKDKVLRHSKVKVAK